LTPTNNIQNGGHAKEKLDNCLLNLQNIVLIPHEREKNIHHGIEDFYIKPDDSI